jgi:F-type H+-transporting ATPase subunit delta
LLTKKGRESYLPEIADSFLLQLQTQRGISSAEVTSAVKLDQATREKVLAAAKKLAGGEIHLVEKVNSELIGGFILKVGDTQLDSSVSNKIKTLRREFSENPYIPEI